MRTIVTIICISLFTTYLIGQEGIVEVDQHNKTFDIVIDNPLFSIHRPQGLIYQDVSENAFTNLNDHFLRIADGPFGYQVQNNSVIYTDIGKNYFSINHYTPYLPNGPIPIVTGNRGFWGPRNISEPYEYDFNTLGEIYSKDFLGRKVSSIYQYNGRGALNLYRYSGGFTYGYRLGISSSGNIELVAVSDRNAKENIKELGGLLPKILQLQLKSYNYKDIEIETSGFIAQEVQEIFPELVSETTDGFLGVNCAGFSPLAIQAIKEQQGIINALEERLTTLENIVNQ